MEVKINITAAERESLKFSLVSLKVLEELENIPNERYDEWNYARNNVIDIMVNTLKENKIEGL